MMLTWTTDEKLHDHPPLHPTRIYTTSFATHTSLLFFVAFFVLDDFHLNERWEELKGFGSRQFNIGRGMASDCNIGFCEAAGRDIGRAGLAFEPHY
jgi:hypothetical protein